MRKLTSDETTLLRLIASAGGSYCPDANLDPTAARALHNLVKAKRLTAEQIEGSPPMYLLTGFCWQDARDG